MIPWLLLVDTTKARPYRVLNEYDLDPVHEERVGKYYVARLLDGDFPEYHPQKLEKGVYLFLSSDGLVLNPPPTNKEIQNLAKKYVEFLKKLPLSTRSWSTHAPKTTSQRRSIFKKFGKYAFLLPESLKFPIVDRQGNFNINGLLAAYKRAAQYHYRKVERLAKAIAQRFGLSWATNPVDSNSITPYNQSMPNEIITILQDIRSDIKTMHKDLKTGIQEMHKDLKTGFEKLPQRIAHYVSSELFGTKWEREALSIIFSFALQHDGEMPAIIPETLNKLMKSWEKQKIYDGLHVTDNFIYVLQAKVNSRDFNKAIHQMRTALETIAKDLKKHKLKFKLVPVFAFEHVDHPRTLINNFKQVKPFKNAELPLLILPEGKIITYDGKKFVLY